MFCPFAKHTFCAGHVQRTVMVETRMLCTAEIVSRIKQSVRKAFGCMKKSNACSICRVDINVSVLEGDSIAH